MNNDLISRKALVKAMLEERDKFPPMLEERYTLGAKVPQRFNQAVRAGIRKALRAIETAPAKKPHVEYIPYIIRGVWLDIGEAGYHGRYYYETPMPICSICRRMPPAHEQEYHEHGGTTVRPRYLELGVHDYSDHALLNELEKRVHPLSEKSNQCLEGGKEPCSIRVKPSVP